MSVRSVMSIMAGSSTTPDRDTRPGDHPVPHRPRSSPGQSLPRTRISLEEGEPHHARISHAPRHRSWTARLLLVSTVVSMVLAGVAVAPHRRSRHLPRHRQSQPAFRSRYELQVIGGIPGGASVEVTGEAENGYLPVTYNGMSGYASAQYLTADGGGGGTTTGPTGTRYVSDGRLNLRSGPGTSYGVIVVMPDGAAVQLTGQVSGSFSQVTYSGTTGWAATEFLATSGPTAPTPTATPIPPTLTATPVTPTPTTPAATATTTSPGAPSIGDTVVGSATVATGGLSPQHAQRARHRPTASFAASRTGAGSM